VPRRTPAAAPVSEPGFAKPPERPLLQVAAIRIVRVGSRVQSPTAGGLDSDLRCQLECCVSFSSPPGMMMVLRTSPEGRAYGDVVIRPVLSAANPRPGGASSGLQVAHGAQGHFGAVAWPQGPGHPPLALCCPMHSLQIWRRGLCRSQPSGALGARCSDPNAAARGTGPVRPPAPWCKCKCSTWRRWPILEVTVDIATPSAQAGNAAPIQKQQRGKLPNPRGLAQ
jgi:hypothetical protein